MKDEYRYQAYIGDAPQQLCFVDEAIEVDYFIKAMETRLKYCPDQKVGIIISAESARRIVKALKDGKYYKVKADRIMDNLKAVLEERGDKE